jgi:hypothetical protein
MIPKVLERPVVTRRKAACEPETHPAHEEALVGVTIVSAVGSVDMAMMTALLPTRLKSSRPTPSRPWACQRG